MHADWARPSFFEYISCCLPIKKEETRLLNEQDLEARKVAREDGKN